MTDTRVSAFTKRPIKALSKFTYDTSPLHVRALDNTHLHNFELAWPTFRVDEFDLLPVDDATVYYKSGLVAPLMAYQDGSIYKLVPTTTGENDANGTVTPTTVYGFESPYAGSSPAQISVNAVFVKAAKKNSTSSDSVLGRLTAGSITYAYVAESTTTTWTADTNAKIDGVSLGTGDVILDDVTIYVEITNASTLFSSNNTYRGKVSVNGITSSSTHVTFASSSTEGTATVTIVPSSGEGDPTVSIANGTDTPATISNNDSIYGVYVEASNGTNNFNGLLPAGATLKIVGNSSGGAEWKLTTGSLGDIVIPQGEDSVTLTTCKIVASGNGVAPFIYKVAIDVNIADNPSEIADVKYAFWATNEKTTPKIFYNRFGQLSATTGEGAGAGQGSGTIAIKEEVYARIHAYSVKNATSVGELTEQFVNLCNWIKLYVSDESNLDSRFVDADHYGIQTEENTSKYCQPAVTNNGETIAVSFAKLKNTAGDTPKWIKMDGTQYIE